MESNELEVDRLIENLNQNKNIAHIVFGNLEAWQLTEAEERFIKIYRPEKALIIYGSLAPNRPNFHIVEHIKGEWKKGMVRGKLENKGWGAIMGYYAFKHAKDPEVKEIEVFILLSDELGANWQMLDDFEGEGYRRILAKYELENGEFGIGYLRLK